MNKGLFWFRRDLRLEDNLALSEASKECDEVHLIFIFDKLILNELQDKNDQRLSFIIDSLKEIENTLARGEGVELRNFGTFRTNIQKASIRRNPKTGEKVNVPKKRTIKWKMSKELLKKLNDEKE